MGPPFPPLPRLPPSSCTSLPMSRMWQRHAGWVSLYCEDACRDSGGRRRRIRCATRRLAPWCPWFDTSIHANASSWNGDWPATRIAPLEKPTVGRANIVNRWSSPRSELFAGPHVPGSMVPSGLELRFSNEPERITQAVRDGIVIMRSPGFTKTTSMVL
jgi:hypothetical protein